MNKPYRTWCEVSLDAIEHNYNEFRKILSPNTKFMGVVKADGYGCGAYETACVLEHCGADFLGVAFIDEAIELRQKGITLPMLILGYTSPVFADDLVKYDIIPTVESIAFAKKLSKSAVSCNKMAKIHVKVDTGMSRLGYRFNLTSINEIIAVSQLPNIEINGIFTHFACADEDNGMTQVQFTMFQCMLEGLADLHIPIKHCCNSAAAMRYANMQLDMVRVGISLYGFYPSDEKYNLDLIPAMQLKSTVTSIRFIEKGDTVSYGAIIKAKEKMKIATVSAGYADGFTRMLTNKAKVIVNGNFLPVVGRICMDQCMIDASSVNNISVEDEVTLFGRQNGSEITVEEIAKAIGTVNYELLCDIGRRVPRSYTRRGQIIHIQNYLLTNDA